MARAIDIPFFGRRDELDSLERRCAASGLTIVKGPPKIGKTRLLRQFVERSRSRSRRVGMAAAAEAGGDALLRAIKDAYTHWLQQAGAVDQLKTVHEQFKGRYISEGGVAFGKALAGFTGPAKDLVAAGFGALGQAQIALRGGGTQIPRLQSEEAHDLLRILVHDRDDPVIIVLNQWEEGQDLNLDVATLRTFLGQIGDWPQTHIILHLRDPRFPTDRNQQADRLAMGLLEFGSANVIEVGPIPFREDLAALDALRHWLSDQLPVLDDLDEDRILSEISGHAAVLEEWAYLGAADRNSVERLFDAASNARALHYPELRSIYGDLLDKAGDAEGAARLEVAILAAVLPLPPDKDAQLKVLPAILGAMPRAELTALESLGLIRPEGDLPLSLGHPTRREAAERCVLGLDARREAMHGSLGKRLRPYARVAVRRAVPALTEAHSAQAWRALDQDTKPTAALLAATRELASELQAGGATNAVSSAAQTLFGPDDGGFAELDDTFAADLNEGARSVVAIGLRNAIADCGADFGRSDALLARLQTLVEAHSDDSAIREDLAMGLANATADSGAAVSRVDAQLAWLQLLVEAHPEQSAIRKNLAIGLNNAVANCVADDGRTDALLARLRSLVDAFPHETDVRDSLAAGLFNAITSSVTDFVRSDMLLVWLESLAESHPDDPAVRLRLVRGLNNAIAGCGAEFRRADSLLDRLRSLALAYPEDPAVRAEPPRAIGASIRNAVNAKDALRAALMAEAIQSLKDEFESAGVAGLVREDLANAIDLAILLDNEDAGRRLLAVSRALFES